MSNKIQYFLKVTSPTLDGSELYSRAAIKPKQSVTLISYYHCKAALEQSRLLKALYK